MSLPHKWHYSYSSVCPTWYCFRFLLLAWSLTNSTVHHNHSGSFVKWQIWGPHSWGLRFIRLRSGCMKLPGNCAAACLQTGLGNCSPDHLKCESQAWGRPWQVDVFAWFRPASTLGLSLEKMCTRLTFSPLSLWTPYPVPLLLWMSSHQLPSSLGATRLSKSLTTVLTLKSCSLDQNLGNSAPGNGSGTPQNLSTLGQAALVGCEPTVSSPDLCSSDWRDPQNILHFVMVYFLKIYSLNHIKLLWKSRKYK